MHVFTFPCMNIFNDVLYEKEHFVQVQVTIHGDAPDCLEVAEVQLFHDNMQPVSLTETQFVTIFPGGQDIINNAFEYAAHVDIREEK